MREGCKNRMVRSLPAGQLFSARHRLYTRSPVFRLSRVKFSNSPQKTAAPPCQGMGLPPTTGISTRIWLTLKYGFTKNVSSRRSGGMVDAVDSKSTGGNPLRVRVSPPVPSKSRVCGLNRSQTLIFCHLGSHLSPNAPRSRPLPKNRPPSPESASSVL